MEKNTINGFEIFDDFMPGALTNNKTSDDGINLDGAVESLTDDQLKELRGGGNDGKTDDDNKDDKGKTDDNKNQDKDDKTKDTKDTTDKGDADTNGDTTVTDDTNNPDDNDDDNAVSTFFNALSEKLGWELEDGEEVPQTPEELVDYFQTVIEENSVPQYASEEVEKLDQFVKNGGNLRDYFNIDSEINLEEVNMEDEVNQKMVVKEFLKEKGFSQKQIDKKLTKYEEAGLLEDEAEDALEALREIKQQKKVELLEAQEKSAKELKMRQQNYFNSVVNEIKGMDDIRGIKIPQKDKQALLEYIFKPTADGKTQYQKDYSKSVKNLLESAYFTMKGDTLLKSAKNEGSTAAINKFKNSLNRTGVSRKTKRQETNSTDSMWDSFARQLRVN